jgi:tripartite-type tricarboxylate transporter receptor subunit TctC
MINIFGSVVRILAVSTFMGFADHVAAQQAYPSKPIRIIVATTSGGSTDILARLIAQKLTESTSQQVFVDNRPGGNGIIGGEALVRSPPDGYTIMVISTTHVITPLLVPTPYDAIRSFAPVAGNARSELILALHPSVPISNLREFIALAKSKPGQLDYATTGAGSLAHLAGALFSIMTEIKMQQIPYKSGGPAIIDLIGGQVQLYFAVPISIMPHIRTGKVKAIAVTGTARLPALPTPTFVEAGLPGFDVKYWYGTLAPAGTPKSIVDRLSADLAKILALPDIREKLSNQGMDSSFATADDLAELMRTESSKYSKIIKTADIKVEK